MIFTEEQAKTKWCPYSRVMVDQDVEVSVNRSVRGGEPDPDCMCVATGCMAWRWVVDASGKLVEAPDGALQGYCGMGGSLMGPQS